MSVQKKRVIHEILSQALESFRAEFESLQEKSAEVAAKITAIEQELEGKTTKRDRRKRRGKGLPFTERDIEQLKAKVADLNLSGKKPMAAARMIYQIAGVGIPLHASLVYETLVSKGIKINAKRRPADVLASYLRRSEDFEKVKPGTFKLTQAAGRG